MNECLHRNIDNASLPLVLGFPEYAEQARRFAEKAGLGYAQIQVHRFPDGDSRVRLPANLPPRILFCRSLDRPNYKLVELALAAQTALDDAGCPGFLADVTIRGF